MDGGGKYSIRVWRIDWYCILKIIKGFHSKKLFLGTLAGPSGYFRK